MASPDSPAPGAVGVHVDPGQSENEAAQWEAAARVRQERPGWVVIWLARKGEFRARPLFRAPPDTVAIGATTEELTAQMDQIYQAAGRPAIPAQT